MNEAATVAEGPAQSAYICAEVGLVDPNAAPDGVDEPLLCDDFAGILKQDLKQTHCTAADVHRSIAVKQLLAEWHKTERAER